MPSSIISIVVHRRIKEHWQGALFILKCLSRRIIKNLYIDYYSYSSFNCIRLWNTCWKNYFDRALFIKFGKWFKTKKPICWEIYCVLFTSLERFWRSSWIIQATIPQSLNIYCVLFGTTLELSCFLCNIGWTNFNDLLSTLFAL